jgi:hypothetical protein
MMPQFNNLAALRNLAPGANLNPGFGANPPMRDPISTPMPLPTGVPASPQPIYCGGLPQGTPAPAQPIYNRAPTMGGPAPYQPINNPLGGPAQRPVGIPASPVNFGGGMPSMGNLGNLAALTQIRRQLGLMS